MAEVTVMREVVINDRWPLILPEHRAARPEWAMEHGGWEVQRLSHMSEYISDWDNVLYVGGEECDMAGLIQSWGAQVFIVEPNEAVTANARAIWEANNLALPAGFYAGFCGREDSANWRDGIAPIWPESAYGPVIGDHGFKELRDPGGRPVVTIDTLVQETGFIPQILSIDVEGSEWEVLQGAEQTLRQHKPGIYLSGHPEFLVTQYGAWLAEVRAWIMGLGYHETLLEYPLHELHLFYEGRA
jgi:FkbM family methyltransferase